MEIKTKLYNSLVNRVPGIRERYEYYRSSNTKGNRIFAWIYLAGLNFLYYIFKFKSIGNSTRIDSDDKEVCITSESSLTLRESAQDFYEKHKNVDVFSFDVFDTLVLRKMKRPDDAFYLLQEKLNYPGLKKIRVEAEHTARVERYGTYFDYEVTLEEIWEKVSHITGIDVADGIAAELAVENEICLSNPYFCEIIKVLIEHNKTVVICSDMYLGEKRIRKILHDCGFPEFAGYFVSCDYRKSKGTGYLFKIIKEQYGNDLTYFHIGDDKLSDVKQAEKNGFQIEHYQNVNDFGNKYRANDMSPVVSSIYSAIINNDLHNGRYVYSDEFEFGFIYGGLLVTGFCQFIHDYVEKNKVDKILFLARDGDIIKMAYEILYPDEKNICEYVYWSRLASTKLSAFILKQHYLERMILHKVNQGYTVEDIFCTMGISDMLSDFVKKSNQYKADSKFNSKVCEDVLNYIDNNWDYVCSHYKEEIEEGRRYFSSIIGDSKSIVTVDVGWVGSGSIILQKMFEEVWGIDCDVKGLMIGISSGMGADYDSTAIETANGKLVSYMFSMSNNRDVWKNHDLSKGHNMIVELLLSSNKKTFRGFTKNENGEYSFNSETESVNATEIQNGILQFVNEYANHPLSHLKIQGRDAAAPIMLLYKNQRYIDNMIRKSGIVANIE